MLALAEELLPKVEDVKADQMGDLVDQEMAQTTVAVQTAADRIAVSQPRLLGGSDSER